MSLEQQALESTARLDKLLDDHAARIQKSLQRLEGRIVSLLGRLDVDETGNVIGGPKVTLSEAVKLHGKLVEEFRAQYGHTAAVLADGFDEMEALLTEFYKGLAKTDPQLKKSFAEVNKGLTEALRAQALTGFNHLGDQAQAKIGQALYDAVLAQTPFSQLVDDIRNAVIGLKDVRGNSLAQYADLYAHDHLMNYFRHMHLQTAQEAGFENFLYYGDTIRDSRPFCVARVGKVFSREEIESWTHDWKGKSGPAMTNCGGYRCRHHWQPVEEKDGSEIKEVQTDVNKLDPKLAAQVEAEQRRLNP